METVLLQSAAEDRIAAMIKGLDDFPINARLKSPDLELSDRSISINRLDTGASLEPAHMASTLGTADFELRELMSRVSSHKGPIFSKHLSSLLEDATGMIVRHTFSEVFNSDYEPKPAVREYSRMFNLPEIVLLSEAIRALPKDGRMLVVAARRNDMHRVNDALDKASSAKKVTIVLQSPEPIDDFEGHHSWAYVNRNTLAEIMLKDENKQSYDALFFPYTLAKVLGECMDRDEMMLQLRSMLRPGGVIYGLYIDADAVRQCAAGKIAGLANEVRIYGDHPDKGHEGTLVTALGRDRVFEDYVLSVEGLESLRYATDELEVRPTRVYFRAEPPPPRFRHIANHPDLEMIRVVHWRTTAKATPWLMATGDRVGFYQDSERALFELDRGTRSCMMCPNRGRPFTDGDLFFHVPTRTIITPKADGIEAVLASSSSGSVFMQRRGDLNYYSCDEFSMPVGVVIQVELIGAALSPSTMVVADILKWPVADSGYESRMNAARIVLSCPGSPFTFPQFTKGTSRPNYDKLLAKTLYPVDGFVLNNIHAPPGMLTGLGAARYVKWEYTVELQHADGRIYEEHYKGDHALLEPRLRLDRHSVTTPEQLLVLDAAWTAQEYKERIACLSRPPMTLERFWRNPPSPELPHYVFSDAELAYFWAPWREHDVETRICDSPYGPAAVDKFRLSLSMELLRRIKESAPPAQIVAPTPDVRADVSLGDALASVDVDVVGASNGDVIPMWESPSDTRLSFRLL